MRDSEGWTARRDSPCKDGIPVRHLVFGHIHAAGTRRPALFGEVRVVPH